MEQYVVSARKYRPSDFSTLIGQDSIATTLVNSIKRGQVSHSYLFCGPRGVGKTTTARIFAKMLNCENPSAEYEPCGKCESCLSFAENRSFCIHELDAASNNSVEDIKTLLDKVLLPPQVGRYSVYIIDEVHMLSTAAFNAFLKTLEEPPAHAIFILATTEKHKIPATILSRCQTYDFNRISIEGIVKNLTDIAAKEGITIDSESKHVIARKADGAMRDALTIFDQCVAFCGNNVTYSQVIQNLNFLDYAYSFKFTDFFLNGNYRDAFVLFNDILAKGFSAVMFVSSLTEHFRNLSIAKAGGADSLLEVPDSIVAKYYEQCGRCDMRFIFEALKITQECEAGYRASINPRLLIEFMLMKLCYIVNTPARHSEASTRHSEAEPVGRSEESSVPRDPSLRCTPHQDDGKAASTPHPETSTRHSEAEGEESSVSRDPSLRCTPHQDDGKVAVLSQDDGKASSTPHSEVSTRHSEAEPERRSEESSVPRDPSLRCTPHQDDGKVVSLPHSEVSTRHSEAEPERRSEESTTRQKRKTRAERQNELAGLTENILSGDISQSVEQQPKETVEQDAPKAEKPTKEDILVSWKALSEKYKDKAQLYSVIAAKDPEIQYTDDDDINVTFNVYNTSQYEWFYNTKKVEAFETFLCSDLNYSFIKVAPNLVKAKPVESKPYLPDEKVRDLIGKNENVKELVKTLDLAVK